MPVVYLNHAPIELAPSMPGIPAPGVEAPIVSAPDPRLLPNHFDESDPVLAGHIYQLPKKARAPKLVNRVVYPFPEAGEHPVIAPAAPKMSESTPAVKVMDKLPMDAVDAPKLEVAPVRKIVRRRKVTESPESKAAAAKARAEADAANIKAAAAAAAAAKKAATAAAAAARKVAAADAKRAAADMKKAEKATARAEAVAARKAATAAKKAAKKA